MAERGGGRPRSNICHLPPTTKVGGGRMRGFLNSATMKVVVIQSGIGGQGVGFRDSALARLSGCPDCPVPASYGCSSHALLGGHVIGPRGRQGGARAWGR